MIAPDMLVGKSTHHLETFDSDLQVHSEVVAPLLQLIADARTEGFDLSVASGFRSFDRQLAIWNGKASGERGVLDESGKLLDTEQLTDTELMWAILRWSALPGTSRHHWGTDLDIWDRNAVSEDYCLQLTLDEYNDSGPFSPVVEWLAAQSDNTGFYFPYRQYRGGVMPEPWHISYRPVASRFEQAVNVGQLARLIEGTEILLKNSILDHLEEIVARFVLVSL